MSEFVKFLQAGGATERSAAKVITEQDAEIERLRAALLQIMAAPYPTERYPRAIARNALGGWGTEDITEQTANPTEG